MSDPAAAAASATAARVADMLGRELQEVAALPADTAAFKSSELPLARIKKIMKLDEDIRGLMIAAEAPLLFSKAAELLIKELTLRAWLHTERNRRRTLQRSDISASVYDQDTDQFDFLIDIVPREEPQVATPAAATATARTPGGGVQRSQPTPPQTPRQPQQQQPPPTPTPQQAVHGVPVLPPPPPLVSSAAPTTSAQAQAPVQYVIQLAAGPGGGISCGGQPMQIAFLPQQQQQQSAVVGGIGCVELADSQQLQHHQFEDVKPDISQMMTAPVPISFAGL